MSTDHQRYSIQGQKEAIAEYALLNDIEIVRTYADEHKSGLTIKRRPALKRLIYDVQQGHADFEIILVFDVSRWGRFQDADESAYYEFICKAAGVSVIYCAEPFENDGTTLATLIKVLKRAMAGEYSRELSVRIARAHKYYAKLGFHQGGTANYGLRRFLVDGHKQPIMALLHGQAKSLQTDRVILVPGPGHEVQTVQEIFRLFVVERLPQYQIAQHLNNKGICNAKGNPWSKSNIAMMLSNEKYAGTFVYCRSAWPLEGGRTRNSRDEWVRVEGAIEPLIDRSTFESAQGLLNRWAFTDNEMLDHLTAVWCNAGYLSAKCLNNNKLAPTPVTYRDRFGSLLTAYRLVGFRTVHAYRYSKCGDHIRLIHRNLICQLTSLAGGRAGVITYDEERQVLQVDGELAVAVVVLPYLAAYNTIKPGWKLYFDRLEECDAIFLARMNKKNTKILDYYVLPRKAFSQPSVRFTEVTIKQFRRFRLRSLAAFHHGVKRTYA
jgi:DNA invertase Pin-like site-specific DNA recombinase